MIAYSKDVIKSKLYDVILEKYTEILSSNYMSVFSVDPTPFRMRDVSNIKGVIVNETPLFPDNSRELYFIFTPNKGDSIEELIFSEEMKKNHYKFQYGFQFVISALKEQFNIHEADILYKFQIAPAYFNHNDLFIERITGDLDGFIRAELKDYHSHINHPASYYAKNAAKYSYSLLDLSEVINYVSDEDFEYQLNEAIAAYDNSLYTACAATLGVTIETLCIQLLKNNNIKMKDSDSTMIDRLADRLKEKGLVTRKEQGRLLVAYKVRNLASHTSRGQIVQADCNFLLSVIHDLGMNKFLD